MKIAFNHLQKLPRREVGIRKPDALFSDPAAQMLGELVRRDGRPGAIDRLCQFRKSRGLADQHAIKRKPAWLHQSGHEGASEGQ